MKLTSRFLIIGVFLTALLIVTGCAEEASGPVEERETPVKVANITFGSLSGSNILNGTIIAEDEAEITPNAMGEIQKINVKKGDTVKAGQVLAELNNFDERNALQQQQASLRQAQAGLKSAQNGKATAQGNVKQAQASLAQAQASLEEAKKSKGDNIDNIDFQIKSAEIALKQTEQSFKRVEELYNEGLTSKQNYDEAKIGVENAKTALEQVKLQKKQAGSDVGFKSLEAAVEQARVGVEIATSSISDTDVAVEQAQAGVDQAQLGVDAAQERLDDKMIKSPIAGEVIDVAFKVGEMASQQAPFATIVSLDRVKVSVNVLPEMLSAFKEGDEVKVQVGSSTETYKAKVSYISSISTGSGLFAVEADLDSENKEIRPGMVASIELDEVLVADSILVPTDAIIQQEGLDVVFIVEDNEAVRKEVEVIRYGTDETAVVGDLGENDKVVISGQNLLQDGNTVTIVEEE